MFIFISYILTMLILSVFSGAKMAHQHGLPRVVQEMLFLGSVRHQCTSSVPTQWTVLLMIQCKALI